MNVSCLIVYSLCRAGYEFFWGDCTQLTRWSPLEPCAVATVRSTQQRNVEVDPLTRCSLGLSDCIFLLAMEFHHSKFETSQSLRLPSARQGVGVEPLIMKCCLYTTLSLTKSRII